MTDLAADLERRLKDFPRPRAEFEVRYVERDPPTSAFAYDLLHLDREVRRAAREIREGVSRGPIHERRRRRPLRIEQGLVVDESHRSEFSFLLEIPPHLYELILSDPVDFVIRVAELSGVFEGARRLILRRRSPGKEDVQEELDLPASQSLEAAERVPDKGVTGGTIERIERITFPDGTVYELIERVER